MRPLVSIISIVNKLNVFEEFKDSLNTQKDISYELIPIMNTDNQYSSARKAYNDASLQANGKYIVFCHPDIRFLEDSCLSTIVSYAESIGSFGVIGIAGATDDGTDRGKGCIVTSIVHGTDAHVFGDMVPPEPEEVQTVDECFFIVNRDYFSRHIFPEREGWHLYAVEYCLLCLMDGLKNYAVPANIWHQSEGKSLDEKYVEQVNDLVNDYKDHFDCIHTTIRSWRTRGAGSVIFRRYYWFKQYVKRLLRDKSIL